MANEQDLGNLMDSVEKRATEKAGDEKINPADTKAAESQNEDFDEEDEKIGVGGKIIMGAIVLIIVVIWLAIFALLVKMDVGGFGSTVLFPVLKDVPYVNMILPGIEEYNPSEDDSYSYKTVEEAVTRIKELETEIEELKSAGDDSDAHIQELETAANELAEYKAKESAFEQEKEKFYEEVVFSDNAPDINTYKTYYESIDPENAEAIYKQVVTQLQEDAELKEYVDTYSNMKPKNAAAIFDSMTDNLELVCEILNAMDAASRADILAAMDEKNAAAVTAMMEP